MIYQNHHQKNLYKNPYSNSSSSLPNYNFDLPKEADSPMFHKKYHSVRKSSLHDEKQYILPIELANREDIDLPVEEHLIVELYSK